MKQVSAELGDVLVAAYESPLDAEHHRGVLIRYGIGATVHEEGISAFDDSGLFSARRFCMRVPSDDAARATTILEAEPRILCEEPQARVALRTAFVGLGIPPVQLCAWFLIGRLARRWPKLSPDDRKRTVQAAVLSMSLPLIVLTCVLYFG